MTQPDKVMTACPSCKSKLAVPSSSVGKKIRCPKCQTVVAITSEMVIQPPQNPPEVIPIPAATAKQAQRPEVSLGAENTYAGPAKKNTAPESLGDEATFGGGRADRDDHFTNDMEIVDLSARYTIEGLLGKGGMGEVQLATDNRLKRKVAIKRVLGDMAKSQTAVRRFITEAQSIAALNHPNIVHIYDYGRDKSGPFLILEFVDGCSLLDLCRDGAMPLERAVDLISQLSDGLSIAHDARIIHRDIKPANVLLTKTGIPKLTDFGLAKDEAGDSGLSMAGAVLGTLDFMPPEQRNDAALVDSRSDLWSLAATLYQMVTGELPRVIDLDLVPQALRPALAKALKAKKDDRYQTAREFKEALRASLQDTGPEVSDLGEGQCLHCGTKNESHRKFCKECAVSLRVPCLQCNIQIPVWDKICSECGTKQGDLLEERRKAMSAQQSQAENLLKNYDFDQAVTIAVALRDEPDLRLHQLKDWSKQFLDEVESGRTQQLERIGTLLSEASQHEQAYDYPSGIHTLEQVPEILRGTSIPGQSLTAETLLKRLTETQSEVHRLDELIRQRGETRQLNGLLQEVDSLLKLCPDRSDLQTLKEQLADRDAKLIATRDAAFAAAQERLRHQDYAGAIKELERVNPYVLQPKITTLREEAESLQRRLEMLQTKIATALEQKQLHGLLKTVEDGLSLKAGDAELEALRERLIKREEKNASEIIGIVEKAKQLRSECQFAAASLALQRIPEELQTPEVLDLMVNCDAMAAQRKSKADTERQRKLLIRLGILAATLVLVLACGLIIRSSMRAAADRVAKAAKAEADRVAEAAKAAKAVADRVAEAAKAVADRVAEAERLAAVEAARVAELERVKEEKRAALAAVEQKQWDVVATFPPSVLATLPPSVLAKLPAFANSIGISFKWLPGGPNGLFSIGITEVTQAQYESVMGDNPSRFKGEMQPVETVSWGDAVLFCEKLSALPAEVAAGREYRLPAEAEWEYACRAGKTTAYSFGDDESQLVDYAWYDQNSKDMTHPVGQKKPNGWGLYDMHGNVWEWCADKDGSFRVFRGGCWFDVAAGCRAAYRDAGDPALRSSFYGFRLALSSPSVKSPEAEPGK